MECYLCNKEHESEIDLLFHMKHDHGYSKSGVMCPNCGKEMMFDYVGEFEHCPACKYSERRY